MPIPTQINNLSQNFLETFNKLIDSQLPLTVTDTTDFNQDLIYKEIADQINYLPFLTKKMADPNDAAHYYYMPIALVYVTKLSNLITTASNFPNKDEFMQDLFASNAWALNTLPQLVTNINKFTLGNVVGYITVDDMVTGLNNFYYTDQWQSFASGPNGESVTQEVAEILTLESGIRYATNTDIANAVSTITGSCGSSKAQIITQQDLTSAVTNTLTKDDLTPLTTQLNNLQNTVDNFIQQQNSHNPDDALAMLIQSIIASGAVISGPAAALHNNLSNSVVTADFVYQLNALQNFIDRTSAETKIYNRETVLATVPQILFHLIESAAQVKKITTDPYDHAQLTKLITDAKNYIVVYSPKFSHLINYETINGFHQHGPDLTLKGFMEEFTPLTSDNCPGNHHNITIDNLNNATSLSGQTSEKAAIDVN